MSSVNPPVGLLGATGSVGAATLALLAAAGHRVRVGVRDTARWSAREHAALAESAHLCDLDASPDPEWLAGCPVLVNCAGPSSPMSLRAAGLARRAGAVLVDPAGGVALTEQVRATPAVLGAGLSPGLDVIVVAGLLEGFEPGASAVCIAGGVDELGSAGAADFLAGLAGDAGAVSTVWRDGRPAPDRAGGRDDIEVGYFPRRLALRAFLSPQARRLATDRQLARASWLSGFERGAVLAALTDRATDAPGLALATRLDAAGRQRYYHLLAAVSGVRHGRDERAAILLRAPSAAALSAVVAVAATRLALTGGVGDRARDASDVVGLADVTALAPLAGIRVGHVPAAGVLAVAEGVAPLVDEGVL